MNTPSKKPLMTYEEVSARWNIKIDTLYTLVRRGQVPHVRLGRRLVRFDPDALEEWVTKNTRKPT